MSATSQVDQRQRSKRACDQCRLAKLKCDNHEETCHTCSRKRISCTRDIPHRQSGRPRRTRLNDAASVNGSNGSRYRTITNSSSRMPDRDRTSAICTLHDQNVSDTNVAALCPDNTVLASTNLIEPMNLDEQLYIVLHSPETIPNAVPLNDAAAAPDTFSDAQELTNFENVNFDLLDKLWQLPMCVSTWFDDLNEPSIMVSEDFFAFEDNLSLADTHSVPLPKAIDAATAMMIAYFRQRSRDGSPPRVETRKSWYSAPPLFHMYDREVVNVLLNIGRAHVSTAFPVFSNFVATDRVSKQLCLAMASVGALFSTVDGSNVVAKSLYNDARRLELEGTLRTQQPSFQSSITSTKTMLLLEIYGICSGDKRSYEFVEALHYQTLKAFKSSWRARPQDSTQGDEEEIALLENALTVLDSYRVLLLLRPPCALSLSDKEDKEAYFFEASSVPCTSPRTLSMAVETSSSNFNINEISVISAYAWNPSPNGQESSRTPQLWKSDFVELALERWFHRFSDAAQSTSSLSEKLLYHLTYLNLYSNLALLKRRAHQIDLLKTESRRCGSFQGLREWISGSQFPIALWHAESILSLVYNAMSEVERSHKLDTGLRFFEPPHASYCVYFATLMVWYSTTFQDQPQMPRRIAVDSATSLLSKLKAPVCTVFIAALSELL